MVDHALDFPARDGAIQLEGIPVFLVHVVTGSHRRENIPQRLGLVRVTFEIHAPFALLLTQRREHLVTDFHDRHIRPKGKILARFRLAQQVGFSGFCVHDSGVLVGRPLRNRRLSVSRWQQRPWR